MKHLLIVWIVLFGFLVTVEAPIYEKVIEK